MIKIIHCRTFVFYANITLKHSNVLKADTIERRFRSLYGLSPDITAILRHRLVDAKERGDLELPSNSQPYHLLWALLFMKLYNNEHMNAHVTGVDIKTFRKWSWILIEAIADLYDNMVSHYFLKLALT